MFSFLSHSLSHFAQQQRQNNIHWRWEKELLCFIFYSFNCANLIQQNRSVYVLWVSECVSEYFLLFFWAPKVKRKIKMLSMSERQTNNQMTEWIKRCEYIKSFGLIFTGIWHKIRYQDAQVELNPTKTASLKTERQVKRRIE